jgi:hypothetical protein
MMKQTKSIAVFFTLLVCGISSFAGPAEAGVVFFPDPALEAVVRERLSLPVGDIEDAHVETLDVLDASGKGIVDITGLSHCINLEVVDLSENSVTDVTELSGLSNMDILNLDENGLADILPIGQLTTLTSLSLAYNKFTEADLDTLLSQLVNLVSLDVSGNYLTSVENMALLANLERLILSDNQIGDLSPLAGCSNLTYLNLYKNLVSDISVLAGMDKLQVVDLHGNVITDFSPVQHVPTVYRDTDSDHDSLLDTWEMAHFGDLSADGKGDFDKDGLNDLREYQRGTNPKVADSDIDGMPDGWEVANGLNPLEDDALSDADGDNLSNLKEFLAGTDPRKWTFLLALLAPEDGAPMSKYAAPTLIWESSSPAQYRVEFAKESDFSRRLFTLPLRGWLSETSHTPSKWTWYILTKRGYTYWRVRAKAQDNNEYLSENHSFSMDGEGQKTRRPRSRR